MIVQLMFLLACLTVLVSGMFGLTIGATQALRVGQAASLVDVGFDRALAALRQNIAAAGGPASVFAPPPQTASSGSFTITSNTQITSASAVAPSQTALNTQRNPFANEGRLAVLVTVSVAARDGTVLVRRQRFVTLRTLAQPPYALVAGQNDGSTALASGAEAEGDSGGQTPQPDADDTRIHVQYVPQAGGTPTPADTFAPLPWANANGNAGTWSR